MTKESATTSKPAVKTPARDPRPLILRLPDHNRPQRPLLRFTPTAWAKLQFFRDRGDTEIGGFGIAAPHDLLLIEEFITVRQVTTCVSVAFDDLAVADFFESQVDAGRKPEQFARCWCHTHPGDSPTPSGTDEHTFRQVFGRCDWAVMFVLAQGGQTYARLRFNVGPGGEVLIPTEIDFTGPFAGSDQKAWAKEYERNIQPQAAVDRGLRSAPQLAGSPADETPAAIEDQDERLLAVLEEEWGLGLNAADPLASLLESEVQTMTTPNLTDRDLRQREIVPPERLAACQTTVVGVGAIGRQVALQLAAMGIPWLQLIDPDTVEPVNLACQGYLQDNLGRTKVSATADLCQQINHGLEVHEVGERFRRSLEIGNVLFCCVDSIGTRRLIWQAVQDRVEFYSDGRMSAEVLRVLTACDATSRRHYPTTLFAPEQAYAGACTARSTIFCANIAAGLMVAQFAKFLRRLPVDADLQLNLLAGELTVAPLR